MRKTNVDGRGGCRKRSIPQRQARNVASSAGKSAMWQRVVPPNFQDRYTIPFGAEATFSLQADREPGK
jgi:hypothetical protein